MPRILEHIDEIARRLQRDVLLAGADSGTFDPFFSYSNKKKKILREEYEEVVESLKLFGIHYADCFGLQDNNLLTRPWVYEMFIDVPNDPSNENYKKVCSLFEHEDGTPKFKLYRLFIVPYEIAVSNGERCAKFTIEDDFY